ncbi:hypothetical protein [Umezawaea sp. Da 62-37]|nr:hypothetical protein [Umezawaea sp. Da 62-37]WNV87005.1 hypothetical protein RM788_01565 [Umezawaea sp. Da 62-37]
MLWDTLWQFLPLIVLAICGAVWVVRDLARSTSMRTPQRPNTR